MIPSAHRYRALVLAAILAVPGALATATAAASAGPALAVRGVPVPGPGAAAAQLVSVSCPTAADCWAVGNLDGSATAPLVVATTDGGQRWRRQTVRVAPSPATVGATGLATLSLTDVSCADARHCMAAGAVTVPLPGGAVAVTADGGRSWGAELGPPGDNALVAVHCSGPATCIVVAVAGAAYFSATTDDGGATWQRGADLPPGFGQATGIDCTAALDCLVAGATQTTAGHGTGAVAATTDGGTTLALASVPPGTGILHAVSCSGPSCLAVGSTSTVTTGVPAGEGALLSSADGGSTFVARSPSTVLVDGLGVDCPDGSPRAAAPVCAAVGIRFTHAIPPVPLSAVVATHPAGPVVRALGQRYVPSPLTAVSCPTTSWCVAVGGAELARVVLPPSSALRPPAVRHGRRAGTSAASGRTG